MPRHLAENIVKGQGIVEFEFDCRLAFLANGVETMLDHANEVRILSVKNWQSG
jgi:hypothetical protein